MPGMGGSPPPATPAVPAAPAQTSPVAAATAPGGLPAGITLPPGISLPPGFDLGSIDLGQIGSLVGSLPPGFLDSLTAPGGLGALGGAGGLDLGMLDVLLILSQHAFLILYTNTPFQAPSSAAEDQTTKPR